MLHHKDVSFDELKTIYKRGMCTAMWQLVKINRYQKFPRMMDNFRIEFMDYAEIKDITLNLLKKCQQYDQLIADGLHILR